jgi:formylglycine-generating enzyme required for sulfatase activity
MVVIPPGQFHMGAEGGEPDRYEGPVREVTIAHPFAVGRYEITVAEYRRFVTATGHPTTQGCAVWDGKLGYVGQELDWRDPGLGHVPLDTEPVACISWNDAHDYAAWLAHQTRRHYRLLSEAEWEYVAQTGNGLDTPWGTDSGRACAFANVLDRSADPARRSPVPVADCSDGYPTVAPVGSFPPNPFGLYDVVGNVWEWVEDCYAMPYPATPVDGSAQVTIGCDRRSVRGGSWRTRPDRERITFRGRDTPVTQSQLFGLRIARDLDPP